MSFAGVRYCAGRGANDWSVKGENVGDLHDDKSTADTQRGKHYRRR